ncbi:hypothetical protein GALMADRAFT_271949 [Galerina marginata CBS 339.88]|uniref:SAP domain-containing protein n=1 Tax=Galerina marginata (strain CBS 339.88) TaxID=685588 RepID=A0A067SF74_GALM3|nr:hypothetical protein GALMADRAFT_271949 [Galerina marginata CBS 339.88]
MDEPMDVDSAGGLPFPGEVIDGKVSTQFFNIDGPTKPVIKEWCRRFGLEVSGNKDELKARLRAFSSNQENWEKTVLGPRRMHRGPMTGKVTKTTSKKKSARRAQEIFSGKAQFATPAPHPPLRIPTIAPLTTQTQSAAILEWARTTSIDYPYINKENRQEAARARLRTAAVIKYNVATLEDTNTRLDQILSIVSNSVVHMPNPPPFNTPPSLFTAAASYDTPTAGLAHPQSFDIDSAMCSATPSAAAPPTRSPVVRSITLSDGTSVEFTAADVRPPPAVSFANDLPRLNRMWDDTSKYWDGHSHLIIKGFPIPIVYWPEVYSRSKGSGSWKKGQWKRAKSSWFEWKVIVERWRQTSEEDFWSEFSDESGARFTYTAILDRLADLRKTRDNEQADRARQEYADKFEETFSYKKGNKRFVKVKACEIAKQYRILKGLSDGLDNIEDVDNE